jgi:uncharacterized protein (TIGR03083 family)
MSEPSTADVLSALRASHDRLVAALGQVGDDGATGPSYCDGWSVAQVASHLGSGAEIFQGFVTAGLAGGPAPGGDSNQVVWDAWNAKSPVDQVHDAVTADAAFLDSVAGLSEEQQDAWELELFGGQQSLTSVLRMRLSEHALHTWDVAVALDPSSTVPDDAAALVAENLGMVIGWAGKPTDEQTSVEVRTSSPERAYHLDLGPSGVALSPSLDDTSAASVSLPTEAFVRLVYGRLDPDHTPASASTSGVDLDVLRKAFPGL